MRFIVRAMNWKVLFTHLAMGAGVWAIIVGGLLAVIAPNGFPGVLIAGAGGLVVASALESLEARARALEGAPRCNR